MVLLFLLLLLIKLALRIRVSFISAEACVYAEARFFGLRIVRVRFFYWKEDFYYQINKKTAKPVKKKEKETVQKFQPVFEKFPTIILDKMKINVAVSAADWAMVPIIVSFAVENCLGLVNRIPHNFVKLGRRRVYTAPSFEANYFKLMIGFRLKFSVFDIIRFVLHTIVLNLKEHRRYRQNGKSNRDAAEKYDRKPATDH